EPKGAQIPHRSVPGIIFGVQYLHSDVTQTFLQYSSISWDAFTLELWSALLTGARCVLHSEPYPTLPGLATVIQEQAISVVWLTAALFNAMIDMESGALAGVRQILVGGESVSVEHVRRALSILPDSGLTNGYGPSECTVFACCYSIPRFLDEHLRTIPIGTP